MKHRLPILVSVVGTGITFACILGTLAYNMGVPMTSETFFLLAIVIILIIWITTRNWKV